jgi:hypothetical protein
MQVCKEVPDSIKVVKLAVIEVSLGIYISRNIYNCITSLLMEINEVGTSIEASSYKSTTVVILFRLYEFNFLPYTDHFLFPFLALFSEIIKPRTCEDKD